MKFIIVIQQIQEQNQENQCSDLHGGLMNKELRKIVLDRHNELRNKVAKEEEPGQPPAANMNALVRYKF